MTAQKSAEMSQGEVAHAQLLAAIRSGQYQPGDRLREVEIAQALSLSRTPIREALRKLESEGIVEHRPRIGAVIRSLDPVEVVELYEMRIILERTAAEFSAKHASAAEVDVLRAMNKEIAAAVSDPQTAATLNGQFHNSIYLSTRNRFLLDAARGLNSALMLLGPTTLADAARIATVCAQHDEIIDAIEEGDSARAGSAAVNHLETSLRHRLSVMRG